MQHRHARTVAANAVSKPKKEAPAVPGLRVATSGSDRKDQNVMLQLLSVPVSPDALSFTRRFHVPFNGSVERLTL